MKTLKLLVAIITVMMAMPTFAQGVATQNMNDRGFYGQAEIGTSLSDDYSGGGFLYSQWLKSKSCSDSANHCTPQESSASFGTFIVSSSPVDSFILDAKNIWERALSSNVNGDTILSFASNYVDDNDLDKSAWWDSAGQSALLDLTDAFTDKVFQAGEDELSNRGLVRSLDWNYQSSIGDRPWQFGVDALGVLREKENEAVLWQLRGYAAEQNRKGGSAGFVYRNILNKSNFIWGINTFLDYEYGDGGDFWASSLGAEMISEWLDVRFNRYIGLTDGKIQNGVYNYTPDGFDVEFAVHYPPHPWLSAYGGYYSWDGEYGGEDDRGLRYGIRVAPNSNFRLEVQGESPEGSGKVDLGWQLAYVHKFGEIESANSLLAADASANPLRSADAFDPKDFLFASARRNFNRVLGRTQQTTQTTQTTSDGVELTGVESLELHENVVMLKDYPEVLDRLTESSIDQAYRNILGESDLVFDGASSVPASITVAGAVLIIDSSDKAPHGLYRVVTEVRPENNDIVLATRQALLDDIFAQGIVRIEAEFPLEQEQTSTGAVRQAAQINSACNKNQFNIKVKEPPITACYGGRVNIRHRIDFDKKTFSIATRFINVAAIGVETAGNFDQKISVDLKEITVVVNNVPIFLKPYLESSAKGKIDLADDASAALGIQGNFELEGNANYRNSKFSGNVDVTIPSHNWVHPNLDDIDPNLDVVAESLEGLFDAKAGVEVRPFISQELLDTIDEKGRLGAYIEVGPYAKISLSYDPTDDCVTGNGVVESSGKLGGEFGYFKGTEANESVIDNRPLAPEDFSTCNVAKFDGGKADITEGESTTVVVLLQQPAPPGGVTVVIGIENKDIDSDDYQLGGDFECFAEYYSSYSSCIVTIPAGEERAILIVSATADGTIESDGLLILSLDRGGAGLFIVNILDKSEPEETVSPIVFVLYDHGIDDGDELLVRVVSDEKEEEYYTEVIILTTSGQTITVATPEGLIRIELTALNEGDAPPNTGAIITDKDKGPQLYDLKTGDSASVLLNVKNPTSNRRFQQSNEDSFPTKIFTGAEG